MIPEHWIEHRRPDGERLGWIVPVGDGFGTVDALGRIDIEGPVDWFDAERSLDERGLGYLADRYMLRQPCGNERPVRIGELRDDELVVVADEFGAASAVGANPARISLPFPAPDSLQRPE
ncbi:hypothetical protein GCM10011490_16580 [Pseudoclavibacter endophyticus]|uniref:Uncharacterized protein n=1 Tax=Pseudoclavibacter endophyticus TaxID=1778590 RepID=A0A6H9WQA8_9MICO|nr:hypothetical protein [Pseudoclavibacter endophyticus]KAB1648975.1 hypothetical protein F8O04_01390 [Pseudoclavibacter endophyticus]GGA66617.1 hypothetical protein GCM10011490_16580 [Pseudoclavibacter endophyticus]